MSKVCTNKQYVKLQTWILCHGTNGGSRNRLFVHLPTTYISCEIPQVRSERLGRTQKILDNTKSTKHKTRSYLINIQQRHVYVTSSDQFTDTSVVLFYSHNNKTQGCRKGNLENTTTKFICLKGNRMYLFNHVKSWLLLSYVWSDSSKMITGLAIFLESSSNVAFKSTCEWFSCQQLLGQSPSQHDPTI